MQQFKTGIMSLVMISLLMLSIVGCTSMKNDTIKLGSILILSGEGSSWGIASRNGIDMAVADVNTAGGVLGKQLVVDHQDDKSDPKLAITAFKLLHEAKGVNYIIGGTWSPEGLALKEFVAETGTIFISPSLGVAEVNEYSDHIFNTWPHDYLLSAEAAKLAYDQGHRRVIVLGTEQAWVKDQTRAFTERFESLGGTVVQTISPPPEETNLQSEALKVKESDADAVMITAAQMNVGILGAKQMREAGVTIPFYSVSLDADTITSSQGGYEGTRFYTSLTPTESFAKRYNERFNHVADIGSDTAYDAVMMIAKAMKATGSTDTNAVAAYLNSIKEYDGESGHLISDGKGGFSKTFKLMEVKNSVAVEV